MERKWFVLGLALMLTVTGCARNKELEKISREQTMTITSLNNEIAKLNDRLAALSKAKDDLAKTKKDLERKLKAELASGDVSLSMQERGLVLTVLDRVLFDSGKAAVKDSAMQTLDKVAQILNEDTKDNLIYVDGHTDNEPIHYSGWKSNWELSTGRATEVLHYLADTGSVNSQRLVASGYGEFHPIADNETLEGKQMNRRVEIVISPKKFTDRKVVKTAAKGKPSAQEEIIK